MSLDKSYSVYCIDHATTIDYKNMIIMHINQLFLNIINIIQEYINYFNNNLINNIILNNNYYILFSSYYYVNNE